MKPNNKTETIAISVFMNAALTYFKCQPESIEVRMLTENKEAFVNYGGLGYKIRTKEALREEVAFQLTDKHAALDIDFGCWIQATKNTVQIKRIIEPVIKTISKTEQAQKLLTAIQLGAYTDDPDVAFWQILARIDQDGELLGNTMVIAGQVYNGPGLIDDLAELQIWNGNIVYNRIEGGIFETLYAKDDESDYEFYLYSTDYYPTE